MGFNKDLFVRFILIDIYYFQIFCNSNSMEISSMIGDFQDN